MTVVLKLLFIKGYLCMYGHICMNIYRMWLQISTYRKKTKKKNNNLAHYMQLTILSNVAHSTYFMFTVVCSVRVAMFE